MPDTNADSQGLLDVLIRAGLIAVLVIICWRVFHPFMDLMFWSLILAVTLYPLHRRWKRKWGFKDGRIATIIVVLVIAILLVPVYLLGVSLAASVETALATVRGGGLHVPPPSDAVASWPLIGKPLHGYWEQAATDMTGLSGCAESPARQSPGLAALGTYPQLFLSRAKNIPIPRNHRAPASF